MIKVFKIVVSFAILLLLFSAYTIRRIDYREAMHKNVCKSLTGRVLVYYVFVDTKETYPWTGFDIQSTIDSMQVAINWIREQAVQRNIPLDIKSDYYIGEEYSTIRKNLPYPTVYESINKPSLKKGMESINNWADGIAKRIGATLHIENQDGIPEIKNPKDKERLIAYLRDHYSVESVALVYLVNNYFKSDISVSLNVFNTEDVEFAIVSYKYPSVIANSILNLFGAADLYETTYRRNTKKIQFATAEFPNDIMGDPYAKNINKLQISNFTSYLIGWKNDLNSKYEILLTDKIMNF